MRLPIVLAILLVAASVVLGVRYLGPQTANTVTASFNYTVPPGVRIRTEGPPLPRGADGRPIPPVGEPVCNNWPGTPSNLPCYVDIEARATDDRGATASDFQRWHYTADCKLLPNQKCKKN